MKIRDIPEQPLGKFAVMRHSTKLSRAHFSSLHDSYASASAEAVRLLALSFGNEPVLDHFYYVLEVCGRFQAGPSGLKSLER